MNTGQTIALVLGLIISTSTVIGIISKRRQKIKEWFDKRQTWKTKLEDHEDRIVNVEKDTKEIKADLKSLKADFKQSIDDSREYRRASLGDKIFNHTEKFVEQGYVTKLQLSNFYECVNRYRKCVDEIESKNDLILQTLIKKVEVLPIKMEHPYSGKSDQENDAD